MSRPSQSSSDTLPPTARSTALLLASTPTVQDAQPGVLHQLLELAHRYTVQILSDAQMYAEHAGRSGMTKVEMEDVLLAVQARVGWEFGGRVPKEYILSLASKTNTNPLPSVPEIFGVRLPPASETLTAVDFDLVPNKPPPGVQLYDEEIEEIEDEEDGPAPAPANMQGTRVDIDADLNDEDDEDDEDMEPTTIPMNVHPAPITPSEGMPIGGPLFSAPADDGSDVAEEEDGLFAGGDDEDEDEDEESNVADAMEVVQGTSGPSNGIKRKLVEEEDYD